MAAGLTLYLREAEEGCGAQGSTRPSWGRRGEHTRSAGEGKEVGN